MSGYKTLSILCILIDLFSTARASAANDRMNAVIVTSPCRTYLQEQGKVIPAAANLFAKGAQVSGAKHSKDPRFFLIFKDGKTYVLDSRCVQENGSQAAAPPAIAELPVKTTMSPERISALPKHGKWEARATLFSYKTEIKILDPMQGNFSASTQANALCLGAGYSYPLTPTLQFHADGGLFFGKADARGAGGNASSTQTYQSDGVGIFGLRSTFGVQLTSLSEGVWVGLAIPVLYESVHWDDAGGSITVDHSALHLLGLLLTLEASRGKYSLITEFGFLQKLQQSTWNLGLAYQL